MPPAAVAILADDHPERDAWVDDQARRAQGDRRVVPVDAEHYRGVWTAPLGARFHVFALATELIALEQVSGYVPPRCPTCDCRLFPQDGPGVHSARCPNGWAAYGRCEDCQAPAGERCVKPGTWPHAGRPLARLAPWMTARREVRRAPLR